MRPDAPLPPSVEHRRLRARVKARWRQRMEQIAGGRFALTIMCLLSFADACCSPVLPEVLYVPMILLRPEKRWAYAFWCSAASVIGGVVGYGLGFWLWEHGLRELAFEHIPGFTPEWYAEISRWYGSNSFLWVWLGGFTPLPYKVFTVFAGVCHDKVDFWVFLLASTTSRFPRIYLTAWLLHRLGKPAFELLMKRSRAVILVLLGAALALVAWRQLA